MTPRVPEELQFTGTHEWIREEAGELVVGITDYAQAELTDIVFVELPAPGTDVVANASVLVLESVKTVADVYAPAAGTIVAVNSELKAKPELINRDPYGSGWIFRLRPRSPPERTNWLDASAYRTRVSGGGPSP